MKKRRAHRRPSAKIHIGAHDIFFECPVCHHTMVIDESGAGMVVPCSKCTINVIVPQRPKPSMDDLFRELQNTLQYAYDLMAEMRILNKKSKS